MTARALVLLLAGSSLACESPAEVDPLPSWNDGPAKTAIMDFVDRVTNTAHPDHRPEAERVAVFDNDGTLWSEQPLYFQLVYALDRVRATAEDHPEWREQEPFRTVVGGDQQALASFGTSELMQIVAATHSGMTVSEFRETSRAWLDSARHPRFDRLYRELTYQPMRELLAYLRSNGFQTWIVSGGGVEFLRTFAQEAYGIPPEQVIGSSTAAEYLSDPNAPTMVKLPEVGSFDDKGVKPVNINLHIGRRPILAFGNSDGDFEMLEHTTTGDGARLGLLLHHDDDEREWAYDRESHVGRLDRGLDEAADRGWVVVSMAQDFGTIYGH